MRLDNPFDYSSDDNEKPDWRNAVVYTIEALLMLLLGFVGNGVIS